ncbi:MAG TPA: beta-ketoacyl-ACP synthase III [Syntrophomonadaceae bacterium]|nr:beta-ketoacyl-ACP synthase III [Syntrophomonadaceae bacterium]
MKAQIKGTGFFLPARILSNHDLESMVDTNSLWIEERTGILERRIGDNNMATSDLCYQAAHMALEHSGIEPQDIDLIIVATVTPDMPFPSTACIIQERLKAVNASAFDLEAGCTGFIYALSVAEKILLASNMKNVLVIGAEMLSRITDYEDRSTCILFGDGAGAVILGKGESNYGILSSMLGADGSGADLLYMPAGGSKLPSSRETVENRQHYIKMNGNEVFRFATSTIPKVCNELLASADLTYKDIDLFVPHQANLRIIKTAMKHMKLSPDCVLTNMDRFGNMSSASIPVALSLAEQEGRIKPGDLILTVGFGAGLTYGGAIIRWGSDN